jgi:uncharacterized protein YkwD
MDGALFIEDLSIPDGTDLERGQAFTKTWRLRNTGSCTWGADYELVFVSGEGLEGLEPVSLALTPPGAILDLSVELSAPAERGAFSGIFELRNPAGATIPVGKLANIWVRFTVGGGPLLPGPAQTGVAGTPTPRRSGDCEYSENAGYVEQLAGLINQARREADIPALTWDARLASAAQAHSQDMGCSNFLGHSGSNGSSISERLASAGYQTNHYSEIIAIGSPENAMAQWMASPSHWEAVLDASLTEFGIGYVYVADSDYGGYFTVDIARP